MACEEISAVITEYWRATPTPYAAARCSATPLRASSPGKSIASIPFSLPNPLGLRASKSPPIHSLAAPRESSPTRRGRTRRMFRSQAYDTFWSRSA
eukprot:scaffold129611_cov33-Tisochrysis_lutea.AAC.2